jgi:hydrogenase-4 membrane subunit HyfE
MSTPDGGLILAVSFALLVARTSGSCIALVAGQAVLLAVYAAMRGLYAEAATIVLLNAIGLPLMLHGLASAEPRLPRFGFAARLCAGGVLALLAAPLSVPLAVLLLGILVVAASRDRAIQAIGLLAMQNGVALAGSGLAEPERIAAILPVVPALACAALLTVRRGSA